MSQIKVVLVEPIYSGNVGSVARVMKNFGFGDLILINPPTIDIEAKKMAARAQDVLNNALIYDHLEDLLDEFNYVIGTTRIVGGKSYVREPFLTPKRLKELIEGKRGAILIVFGREDNGLTNDELKRCDVIVNIPSSPDYPTLNISQSVGIILYELFDLDPNEGDTEIPSREEMAHLDEHILRVLNEIEFPRFNRAKTALMLKRILEASGAGRKEIRSIRGILSAVEKKINKFIKNENV